LYVGKGWPIDQALKNIGTVEGYSTFKGFEKMIEMGRIDLGHVEKEMRTVFNSPAPIQGTILGRTKDILFNGKSPKSLMEYMYPKEVEGKMDKYREGV